MEWAHEAIGWWESVHIIIMMDDESVEEKDNGVVMVLS
jgi:hypothetical protein